jgi:hypothetical protein
MKRTSPEAGGSPLERPGRGAGGPPQGGGGAPSAGELERRLCQVGGLNQNYTSSAGTLYHIQIEDRGPVLDRVLEREVRRVNVIVYSNYGEPNARIVHGRDHDYEDVRSQEHNRFIAQKIQELAEAARLVVEEKEQRLVMRIKAAIREYYLTKDEHAKREFEDANALYPFLFSRAWKELRLERERTTALASAAAEEPQLEAAPVDVVYPLDERSERLQRTASRHDAKQPRDDLAAGEVAAEVGLFDDDRGSGQGLAHVVLHLERELRDPHRFLTLDATGERGVLGPRRPQAIADLAVPTLPVPAVAPVPDVRRDELHLPRITTRIRRR